jgi:hypothetical protein
MKGIQLSYLSFYVLVSLASPVGAQLAGKPQDTRPNEGRASEITEEIQCRRLLQKAQLGPKVLKQLLREFEQADQRRQQEDAVAAAEMSRWEMALQDAPKALLDG